MPNNQAIMEGDGGLLFSGEVTSKVMPGQPGGGVSNSSILDIRWSEASAAIQATNDNSTWVDKIPFVAFDA